MVFLSATSPNALEFSEWIGRTKQTKVYVIQTPKRPVPLKHFIHYGKEMYPILSEDGLFIESGYRTVKNVYFIFIILYSCMRKICLK